MSVTNSHTLFARAKRVLPGGVNSPVRAFGSVGQEPRFIKSGKGAFLYDVDDNAFLDYVSSWGPLILGHCDSDVLNAVTTAAQGGLSFGAPCEYEVLLAEMITRVAPIEMVRMVNSGTEAVMSALRLARGFTGKEKIIKFAGCYHGHSDAMLVKAGSGLLTSGVPDSAGVPASVAASTLTARYNDLASVEALFNQNPGTIAALIVEPVAANMGVVEPKPGFLQGLRDLCTRHQALLIFDEVITGFRLALGGAQQYYGVTADLVTYGKIIGGGMPVGAYGGRKDIMSRIAPIGPVYQAGTLSGNPVAMAAGLAQLTKLVNIPNIYTQLDALGTQLANGLRQAARDAGKKIQVVQVGSLCSLFFTDVAVVDYESAKTSNLPLFTAYFSKLLEKGIYTAPSQFEAMFLSAAHTPELVEKTIAAVRETLSEL